MKFSLAWIADCVDLPAELRAKPQEIADRLTAAGLAVEYVEAAGTDTLYDIDVTTNRVDAMNHLGIARELAAIFDRPLTLPAAAPPEVEEPATGAIRVVLEDGRCPRFAARVMREVKVGPSPAWLVERLARIGQRSINNVVDVTNYVLWELGQPVHAYDAKTIAESTIIVRAARAGERLVTLDGQERKLAAGMLVITDPAGVIGLAGVMGGLATEVTAVTTDLVIECAHFDPKAVRQTARGLDLHTDACHRFERGADPEAPAFAASRVAELVQQVAGGEVLAGVVDVRIKPAAAYEVYGTLDLKRLARFIGVEVPRTTVERWMGKLGFELTPHGETAYRVRVPSWRYYDVLALRPDGDCYEADLFEEVARHWGLDAVPATVPAARGADALPLSERVRRRRVSDHLAACGYAEAITFAFHDPADAAKLPTLRPEAGVLELENPLSEHYSVMRRSLLPGLLEAALFNLRRGASAVRLFEVGRVFFGRAGELFPEEVEMVGLIAGGTLGSPWQGASELDYFDLKGAVDGLAELFGAALAVRPAELLGFVPGSTAEILAGGRVVGCLGRLEVEEAAPLFAAELALEALALGPEFRKVVIPSRFPGVAADLTLTHALAVPWSELARVIREVAPALLASFELKDRYQGKGVPEGAVNTTIAFAYQAEDRSLTQEEVNAAHSAIAAALQTRFGVDHL